MRSNFSSNQPAPREGYIPVENAKLYYREIGQGQPPIIILHGGPDFDHSYLLPDMDRLADAFRLIYDDQIRVWTSRRCFSSEKATDETIEVRG